MSNIIKKFQILNELEEQFLSEIKFLYVFKDFKNNVLIVTNDDKVFAFGDNKWGVLGFGNKIEVNKLTTNKELSYKQIIDFKNSEYHVIALTIDGKVYCWGYNRDGVLGNGENDSNYYGPQLNEYLSDKQITHICCGACYTLVLTNSGEVYAWGDNKSGQIGNGRSGENEFQLTPIKVNGFNEEKVFMISCGGWHSMALTERGQVLSWGSNNSGQLGHNNNEEFISKPTIVSLNNKISIKKISCGLRHSLLLSCDKNIYWFGNNGCETQKTPKKLTINTNKFIDIASHYFYDISTALSFDGIYYVWGKFGNEILKVPKETKFKSFDDIFNLYFGITYKTLNLCEKEQNKKENIFKNQIILEEENGEKVEANKTLYNLRSPVNRFNSQSNETSSRYKLDFKELELIGGGSFGKVYKAIYCLDRQQYAVKIILLKDFSVEIKEKSLKELEIMAKIRSDYVVHYNHSWIENNEILYIQMELCFNTLKGIMEQKLNEFKRNRFEVMTPLEYYISSELFKEILEAVNYLHSLKPPIIHRDLKPSNILITEGKNGRFVKLGDFGLATIHESDQQTHTKGPGTPIFMAPEIKSGRFYDTKVDIFSLGYVWQELFDVEIDSTSTMTINNSLLDEKYNNVNKYIYDMLLPMKSKRPTCEQLLNNKIQWALSMSDIQNDSMFEKFKNQSISESLMKNNFCNYFCKIKSMHN